MSGSDVLLLVRPTVDEPIVGSLRASNEETTVLDGKLAISMSCARVQLVKCMTTTKPHKLPSLFQNLLSNKYPPPPLMLYLMM